MKASNAIATFFKYFVLILVGLIMIYPLLWMISATFKDNSEIFAGIGLWIKNPTLEGYKNALNNFGGSINILQAMLNTYSYVIPKVICTVVSACVAAYGFGRFDFPGRKLMFNIMLATLFLPQVVLNVPQYLLYNKFGWLDSPFYLAIWVHCAFATESRALLRVWISYSCKISSAIFSRCVRIIIEPICEARFYPQSYGFRPYRAQKHAIRGIINVINAGCKSPDQPVWAIEGDIKGCFDNINHRLLLQKLWRIGIHDKRVLKIISQMLKAGYMEKDLFQATELGTPQGGILSPLLSNVYLNDFDWYVGRMYMEPHRQCKHKGNDTRRLKWAGVTPKYNYRYADDWVILTSTEKEALRLKRVLTKYFRNRMKLELSQEKTYVTDLRTNGIHFLGFVVKAERKRKTPDPATWTKHLVGKPLPDMERLGKKIKKLLEEVHRIELCQKVNVQAAQIQYVNSVIMGMAQYLQTSICSHAYHAIDRRVNNAALTVWKKLYPKRYNSMQVPLKVLCNLPDRHKGYDSKTFAVWVEGKWFGITYAFITHSHYEPKPFDQKMTPYTVEGRRRYVSYRAKHKPLPCDRPSVNSPNDIALSAYAKGRMNFEYYMNREYAYSRDKGKCKCCGNAFSPVLQKHCHHVKNKLPLDRINKVPNLVWLCEPCHRMVHNSPIPPELDAKTVGKIMKYREKLKL